MTSAAVADAASRPEHRVSAADSPVDVAVVGSGFGGLGAALSLAERGLEVVLFEAVGYPGGCASTFARDGYRFEAGATLFSGLAEDQLLGRWIATHRLPVGVRWLDPVVDFRAPGFRFPVPRDRDALLPSFLALPSAPARGLERFFSHQRAVARLQATFARFAPEWASGIRHELTASPRTFERFTGRPAGLVGGVPRRAG